MHGIAHGIAIGGRRVVVVVVHVLAERVLDHVGATGFGHAEQGRRDVGGIAHGERVRSRREILVSEIGVNLAGAIRRQIDRGAALGDIRAVGAAAREHVAGAFREEPGRRVHGRSRVFRGSATDDAVHQLVLLHVARPVVAIGGREHRHVQRVEVAGAVERVDRHRR